jgi:hypothetical protein
MRECEGWGLLYHLETFGEKLKGGLGGSLCHVPLHKDLPLPSLS